MYKLIWIEISLVFLFGVKGVKIYIREVMVGYLGFEVGLGIYVRVFEGEVLGRGGWDWI